MDQLSAANDIGISENALVSVFGPQVLRRPKQARPQKYENWGPPHQRASKIKNLRTSRCKTTWWRTCCRRIKSSIVIAHCNISVLDCWAFSTRLKRSLSVGMLIPWTSGWSFINISWTSGWSFTDILNVPVAEPKSTAHKLSIAFKTFHGWG
jgi:hypothetical protein